MDLNEIVIFIKVAQLGSFIRASESLELPKSTVSTKVSQLEKRLGVSLIHRTTRKINLTQIGRQFYERCAENIQPKKRLLF
jgi:DNA-binding transcriptional LysR family regulator